MSVGGKHKPDDSISQLQRHAVDCIGHQTDSSFHQKDHHLACKKVFFGAEKWGWPWGRQLQHPDSPTLSVLKVRVSERWWVVLLLSQNDSQAHSHSPYTHFSSLFPPPFLLLISHPLSMPSSFLLNKVHLQRCLSPLKLLCWGLGWGEAEAWSGVRLAALAECRLGVVLLLLFTLMRLLQRAEEAERK